MLHIITQGSKFLIFCNGMTSSLVLQCMNTYKYNTSCEYYSYNNNFQPEKRLNIYIFKHYWTNQYTAKKNINMLMCLSKGYWTNGQVTTGLNL